MKKLVKILVILTVGFLAGGMIIGCSHATDGIGGLEPNPKANPINLASMTGGSVPAVVKAYIIDHLSGEGGEFPYEDPNNWSFSDWQKAFEEFKAMFEWDSDRARELGLPSNPDNWSNSDWTKALEALSEEK
jgi:hypothetical protein